MLGKFFNTTEVDSFADRVVGVVKHTLPTDHDPAARNIGQGADRLNMPAEEVIDSSQAPF